MIEIDMVLIYNIHKPPHGLDLISLILSNIIAEHLCDISRRSIYRPGWNDGVLFSGSCTYSGVYVYHEIHKLYQTV